MEVDSAAYVTGASTTPLTANGSTNAITSSSSSSSHPSDAQAAGESVTVSSGQPLSSYHLGGEDATMTVSVAQPAVSSSSSSVFVISSSASAQPTSSHLAEQSVATHPSQAQTIGQHASSQSLHTLITGAPISLPPMTSGQFDMPSSSIFAVNPQSAHGYPVLWLTNSAIEQKVCEDGMRLPPVSEVRSSSRVAKEQVATARHQKETEAAALLGAANGDAVGMSESQRVAMNAYIAAQMKQHHQQQDSNALSPVSELSVTPQMALSTEHQQLDAGSHLQLVALSSAGSLFAGGSAAANIYSMAPSQLLVAGGESLSSPSAAHQHHHHHHNSHLQLQSHHHNDTYIKHQHQSATMLSHVTSSGHVLLTSTDSHFATGSHHHHNHHPQHHHAQQQQQQQHHSLTAADLMDSMTLGPPPRLQVIATHNDSGSFVHDYGQEVVVSHHQHQHLLDKTDGSTSVHTLPSLQMLPQGTLVVQEVVQEVVQSSHLSQAEQQLDRQHPKVDAAGGGQDQLVDDCGNDDLDGLVETLACYRCKACPYISLSKEGVEQHVRNTHMAKPAPSEAHSGKRPRRSPPDLPEVATAATARRGNVIREPDQHRHHHTAHQHGHHSGHRDADSAVLLQQHHQHHDPAASMQPSHHHQQQQQQLHASQDVRLEMDSLQQEVDGQVDVEDDRPVVVAVQQQQQQPLVQPQQQQEQSVGCGKEDTYICGMCEKGFADIESCSVHMAVEHNVPVDHVQLEPIEQSTPSRHLQHHDLALVQHHQPQLVEIPKLPPLRPYTIDIEVAALAQPPPAAKRRAAVGRKQPLDAGSGDGVAPNMVARKPARRRQPKAMVAPIVAATSVVTDPTVHHQLLSASHPVASLSSSPIPASPAENGQSHDLSQLAVTKVEEEETEGATYVMDIVEGSEDDDSDSDSCLSLNDDDDVIEDLGDEDEEVDGEAAALVGGGDQPEGDAAGDKCELGKRRGRPKGSKTQGVVAQRRIMRRNADLVLGHRCALNNCGIRMQSGDNMEYHRRCHSARTDKYECPECHQECGSWKTMSIHLWRVHVIDMELYACDLCSYKTYSYGKLMNMHRRIHSEDRPFLCDICGKGFKTNKQLRNHKVIHMDKRRFRSYRSGECDVCQRHFSDKRMLRVHKDTVHNKLRPYLCNFCGYSASCRSTLKMHVRQHTGEKPFTCSLCEYRTADHNSLRRHKMRHSGEKPYKCPFCPYACIQSSTYKTHLRNKHPGMDQGLMFCCERCSFRTIKRDNFVTHVADHRQEDEAATSGLATAPHPTAATVPAHLLQLEQLHVQLLPQENASTSPSGHHHHQHHLDIHLEQQQQQQLEQQGGGGVVGQPQVVVSRRGKGAAQQLQQQPVYFRETVEEGGAGQAASPLPEEVQCGEDGSLQEMPLHPGHFIFAVPEEMRQHVAQQQHLYKVEMHTAEEKFPILASQLKLGHSVTSSDDGGATLRSLPEPSHRDANMETELRQQQQQQ